MSIDLSVWNDPDGTPVEGTPGDTTSFKDADQPITNAGFVDVTKLTFPVKKGKAYRFESWVIYQSSVTTMGVQIALNGPALGTLMAKSAKQIAVGGTPLTDMFQEAILTAYDTPLPLAVAEVAQGANLLHTIEGIVIPNADGNFAVRMSKENVAGTATVKVGSYIKYRTMT